MFMRGEVNEGSFTPGAALCIYDLDSRTKTVLLSTETGLIRDPELSYDATRVIFSMRPEKNDGYHIYEIGIYGLGTIGVCGEDSVPTRRIAILTEIFAMIGLMLMTIGTFLGAVWAGESWGSYWSWDPKETWALVTILVYTICTHSRLVPKLNRPHWLFILSIAGMACVLMTYFGVNYFLVGMHSYAS